MLSSILSPRLVCYSALACVFAQLGGASNIGDIFHIKPGTTNGGCDAVDLTGMWEDVQKLSDAAMEASTNAKQDPIKQKYITTFYRIPPSGDPTDVFESVEGVDDHISGKTVPTDGKPWLFCNSDWLVEQTWTSVAINATNDRPRDDGQTVEQVEAQAKALAPAGTVPFWSSDLKQYIITSPGDYCSTYGSEGVTQDQTKPATITLCPQNFKSHHSTRLANIPPVTKQRVSIGTLQAHPMTLYHEMVHLAFGTTDTLDQSDSYELAKIIKVFDTRRSLDNPETYAFYALAWYLGKENPEFKFYTGSSYKPKP